MSEHSKNYESIDEWLVANQALSKFQKIHNIIRKDYIELLKTTEDNKTSEITFNALYRASLRSLFSLIEADVFGLNCLDQYNGYRDNETFIKKFKCTFKQIAITWNKEAIQKSYFDSKLNKLMELKKMRDELVHPKEINHIHEATEFDFIVLKNVFNDYDKFINDLMNDFFISIELQL